MHNLFYAANADGLASALLILLVLLRSNELKSHKFFYSNPINILPIESSPTLKGLDNNNLLEVVFQHLIFVYFERLRKTSIISTGNIIIVFCDGSVDILSIVFRVRKLTAPGAEDSIFAASAKV